MSVRVYLLSGLLALLAADDLAVVAEALALVRLRLLHRADLGCKLTDHFLVDSGDRDVVLLNIDAQRLARMNGRNLPVKIMRDGRASEPIF